MAGVQGGAFTPLRQVCSEGTAEDEPVDTQESSDIAVSGRACGMRLVASSLLAMGCVAALSQAPPQFARRPSSHGAVRGSMQNVVSSVLMEQDVADICPELDADFDYDYTTLAGLGHLDNCLSSEDCCMLCQGEPHCKAFTWVQDAHLALGSPGQCWLKGGDYRQRDFKKGVFSAFVRDPGVEMSVMKQRQEEEAAAAAKKKAEDEAAKAAKEAEMKRDISTTLEQTSAPTALNIEIAMPTSTATTASSLTPVVMISTAPPPLKAPPIIILGPPISVTTATNTSTSTDTSSLTSTETSTVTTIFTQIVTSTSTSTEAKPCCSFEPLVGCGHPANISYYCDVSRSQCENDCAGKWLAHGPQEKPDGLDFSQ